MRPARLAAAPAALCFALLTAVWIGLCVRSPARAEGDLLAPAPAPALPMRRPVTGLENRYSELISRALDGRIPRLLVTLVVDQFSFQSFERLVTMRPQGAFAKLSQAGRLYRLRFGHAATLTAPGHATLFTGASPGRSGVIANAWYDRRTRRHVYCVEDPRGLIVESELDRRDGRGPRQLRVDTISDVLSRATRGKGITVALSIKDRSAILPAGHRARVVVWYSAKEGAWVTSQAYARSLPRWVGRRNKVEAKAWARDRLWRPLYPELLGKSSFSQALARTPRPTQAQREAWSESAFAQDALFGLAREALAMEALGQDDVPDHLIISVSTTDMAGHKHGPLGAQTLDLQLRVDQALGELWSRLESTLKGGRYTLAITSDHGVAPLPVAGAGGRLSVLQLAELSRQALAERLGPGVWLEAFSGPNFYFSPPLVSGDPARYAQAVTAVRNALERLPGIHRVFDFRSLTAGQLSHDAVARAVTVSYDPERSGDLYVVWKPGWISPPHGTHHGSPWDYDTDVPLILYGTGVRPKPTAPGEVAGPAKPLGTLAATALAPTLAAILGIPSPPASESAPAADVQLP